MSKPSTLLSCPTLVCTDLYICILDGQMLNPHIYFLEIKICNNTNDNNRRKKRERITFVYESEYMNNTIRI